MDRLLYVDGFRDVASAYMSFGHFWLDLAVALSAPVQLLGEVLEALGAIDNSELGGMQVRGRGARGARAASALERLAHALHAAQVSCE